MMLYIIIIGVIVSLSFIYIAQKNDIDAPL